MDIRRQMAHDADHDVDLFVEMVRSGCFPTEDVPLEAADEAGEEPGSKAA